MNTDESKRRRGFALGGALLLTGAVLGVVVQSVAGADLSSGSRPVSVTIEPCRVTDTRPATQVGPRNTPLGAGQTMEVVGRGASGECSLRSDTVGLILNVTAVGATAQTNVRVFPSDAAIPNASNLNPGPGQPPTPNAVTTSLSSSGRFSVFNANGSVDLVIDVVGVLVDHNHDDRYYTKAEVDSALPSVRQIVQRRTLPANSETEITLTCASGQYPTNAGFRILEDTAPGEVLLMQSFQGGWGGTFDDQSWALELANTTGGAIDVDAELACVSNIVIVN